MRGRLREPSACACLTAKSCRAQVRFFFSSLFRRTWSAIHSTSPLRPPCQLVSKWGADLRVPLFFLSPTNSFSISFPFFFSRRVSDGWLHTARLRSSRRCRTLKGRGSKLPHARWKLALRPLRRAAQRPARMRCWPLSALRDRHDNTNTLILYTILVVYTLSRFFSPGPAASRAARCGSFVTGSSRGELGGVAPQQRALHSWAVGCLS